MPDDVEDLLKERLRQAEAIVAAVEHSDEVVGLLRTSANAEEAFARLTQDWNLDPMHDRAVLGMGNLDFTQDALSAAIRRVQQLRAVLNRLAPEGIQHARVAAVTWQPEGFS